MNVPTLLTVAVLVGWLATLISAVNLVRIGTPRRWRRSGGRPTPIGWLANNEHNA
jgi:hypothetical protein